MTENFLSYGGKIIAQLLGEILYFPLWWYSVGFGRLLKNTWHFWHGQEESLGFWVWLKNIFVPMYGQYDMAGRVISFFVRLVQIIGRGFVLLIWLILLLVLIAIWLIIPPLLLLALVFQLWR